MHSSTRRISTGNIVALKRVRVDAIGYEEGISKRLHEISLFRSESIAAKGVPVSVLFGIVIVAGSTA